MCGFDHKMYVNYIADQKSNETKFNPNILAELQ